MPMPKHREPLVKTSVSITERQQAALEDRARKEDRPVSHFVREALDGYFDVPTEISDTTEIETQRVA